jgi:RNA polymerase sigma-70 factor (ECF subfamily)
MGRSPMPIQGRPGAGSLTMPQPTDAELLLAAGTGDADAFRTFVERHQFAVVQFAHRFLPRGDLDAAEDLAQDAFLSVWQAAPTFEPRAAVRTWLFRIVANACLNYRRSRRIRRTTPLPEGAEAGAGTPLAALEADESAGRLRDAVAELPPTQRTAVLLRYFHAAPCAEIAEILGLSDSAVESLLFRARRTLHRTLKKTGDFPQADRG